MNIQDLNDNSNIHIHVVSLDGYKLTGYKLSVKFCFRQLRLMAISFQIDIII